MGFWTIRQVARVIQSGGVIAYPTEAVYGLGCNPYDARAVIRLLEIKHRDPAQGLILIGWQLENFADFIQPLDAGMQAKVMAKWPGPVTWLLPASDRCPYWLRGEHKSIAVRVTAHRLSRQLCRQAGMALVSTSANRHGHPPAVNARQVRQRLGGEVDYVLWGQTDGLRQPSEIYDAITDRRLR